MRVSAFHCINYVYISTCFLATIFLSIYSLHRYIKNEDITLTKITTFLSTKDAIYPSLSFCILDPFLKENFEVYGDKEINATSYVDFLLGNTWNELLEKVDYDHVTISLSESLKSGYYITLNKHYIKWDADFYVSFRSASRKCFTINAPFPERDLLWIYSVNINDSIFPKGARSYSNKILTYIHYPGQRLTSYYTMKQFADSRQNKSNEYVMEFEVRNIDVISRRNKINEPCVEDWKNYDQFYMENLMNNIGCHPPQWKFDSKFPNCSSDQQMRNLSRQPLAYDVASFTQPCKIIDRLDYTYSESDLGFNKWS